jgi:magnesium-transporting ATPase (P-type)
MVRKRKEAFKVIAEFPFDSDRKRMSILVKDEDGAYILYTKGADMVMLDRINYDKNGIADLREIIE